MKRVRVDGELGDVVTDLILDDADVTAQRLLDTDSHKRVKSTNASSYVAGTANQITVTGASGGVTVSLPSVIVPPKTDATSYLQFSNNNITSSATLSQADVLSQVALTNPTACYIQMTAPSSRVLASSAVSLETVGASSNASVISGSSGAVLLKRGTTTDVQSNSSALALTHGTAITAAAPTLTLNGSSAGNTLVDGTQVNVRVAGSDRAVFQTSAIDLKLATGASKLAITSTATIVDGTQVNVRAGSSDRIVAAANDLTLNSSAAGSVTIQNNTTAKVTVGASTTSLSNGQINVSATSTFINLDGAQAVLIGTKTTAQRTALNTPLSGITGALVFDSTLGKLCVWTGSAWEVVTSV